MTSLTTVHYNNITTGMYPASYMASRTHCSDCHYDDSSTTNLNASRRHEWARSGHAATTDLPWIEDDFKTKSGCVQCHTTTGFIAYSTGKVTAAWGVATDKTKEVLACNGCHKDVTTGSIRTVTPVRPFADDTYVNRNVGESNICMDCHSGTNNGLSITAKLNAIPAADFTNLTFVDPHYLAAGGTLHGKAGYQFSGRSYAFYSTNTHRTIGIGNTNGTGTAGPCIACHKNSVNGHTFVAGFQNGAIPVCANCHSTYLDAAKLAADQTDFANAMGVLRAQLAAKGFVYYSSATPRFPTTNWGFGQAGADTMGAAFNYALFRAEPGAYAHNSAYTKQLLCDSIDYLYNGRVTGSIDGALASLLSSGAISQTQSDSMKAYVTSSSCTSCHNPGTTGSHSAHLDDKISCSVCHSTTAATSTALVPGTVTHLNGMVDIAIAAAVNGNYDPANKTCSSLYCHSNGTSLATGQPPVGGATWGSTGITCTSCHGYPPSYPTGEPKANNHSNHDYSCNSCHAGTTLDGTSISDHSLHANRAYNVTPGVGVSFTYAYAPTGGTCSNVSCHHNGTATWGSTLGCDGCHDCPPVTPSHVKHYSGTAAQGSYGSTKIAQDFSPNATGYIMNCGNCHPMDSAKHMNGVVEVELYNASAPAGSLKALNPSSAAYVNGTSVHTDSRGFTYTAGTCSNVYCHSYNQWTTTQAIPVNDPNWQSKTVVTRMYRTIKWDSASLTCSGCHGNPTRTSYPANDGGAGDSHAWLDSYGYENLHSYNMGYEPLSCTYCHHETVRQFNAWTRDANDVSTLSNVPIYNFSRHVNGRSDVVFHSHTSIHYHDYYNNKDYYMSLATASYDQGTKTCSNVSCHLQETSVKWGTPYRWDTDECYRCHGY
jgi:predicted CxxxxCH...CXXCH cytochrome family protein